MEIKKFASSEENIIKYVFNFGNAITEAVLYKYGGYYKRTVLCISVQSGCPVGCIFCGTGNKFIRNLNASEIISQVTHCLSDVDIIQDINKNAERLQIMFMSMGEPFLNYPEVKKAIIKLHDTYNRAELLISTIAPKKINDFIDFTELSKKIDKIGLQFSIHDSIDEFRDRLIPYKNKFNLREIRDLGSIWHHHTRRPVYLNYCVSEKNQTLDRFVRLKDLFSPTMFNFTFSVICSDDENMKDRGYKELNAINKISNLFLHDGYNVRVFNPDGQDDIGGGCGQLWYVQNWMKNYRT